MQNIEQINKEIVILYHADCLDGFSGAWAAWKKFGSKAEYIPVHHQKAYPEGIRGKEIYFLDFAYPEEITKEIIEFSEKVVIIDHHKEAEETAKIASDHLFSNNNSGAVLAWKYFHPEKQIPKLLRYVEDMDLWKFKMPKTEEAIAFIESTSS